jgi:hypothetical protein
MTDKKIKKHFLGIEDPPRQPISLFPTTKRYSPYSANWVDFPRRESFAFARMVVGLPTMVRVERPDVIAVTDTQGTPR